MILFRSEGASSKLSGGFLNAQTRKEILSHVTAFYGFQQIPGLQVFISTNWDKTENDKESNNKMKQSAVLIQSLNICNYNQAHVSNNICHIFRRVDCVFGLL